MRMLEIRPTNNFRGASNQLNWKFPTLGQHDAEIIISGSERLKMFEGEKSKKIRKKDNKKNKKTDIEEIKFFQNLTNLESMLKTYADDVTVLAGGGGRSGHAGRNASRGGRGGRGHQGNNNRSGRSNNGLNGESNNGNNDANMDITEGDNGGNNDQRGGNDHHDEGTDICSLTFEGNLPRKLDVKQLCREIMKADSNASIHPSTKGGNLPQPFINFQEINAFNFNHLRTFLTFFEEDRDTVRKRYEIKVNVKTQAINAA